MEYIILFIILVIVIVVTFKIAWYLFKYSTQNTDENISSLPDLYCFECEIEMPVKEKKGRLYCSNCGLYHF